MNRQLTGHHVANRPLARSADRELQDNNFLGSLDQFAKRVGSRESVDRFLPMYTSRLLDILSYTFIVVE